MKKLYALLALTGALLIGNIAHAACPEGIFVSRAQNKCLMPVVTGAACPCQVQMPTHIGYTPVKQTCCQPACPCEPCCACPCEPCCQPACPCEPCCQPACPCDPCCQPACPCEPCCQPACPCDPCCQPACPCDPCCNQCGR